jgi:hypothetical protein
MMMQRFIHTALTTVAFVAAVAALSASVKFTSTFKSLDAGSISFVGKKVAALVITNDDSLRVAGEESLARELNALGMQAVATYRIAPKEEMARAETAKPWFEKANVEGVVAVRQVSMDTETYTTGIWTTANYSTLWGYYGYGWTSVYAPASSRTQTVVVVETTIYSVPRNQLIWAAVSKTTNPRDVRGFFDELSKEMVKEMQKQGLARGQKR